MRCRLSTPSKHAMKRFSIARRSGFLWGAIGLAGVAVVLTVSAIVIDQLDFEDSAMPGFLKRRLVVLKQRMDRIKYKGRRVLPGRARNGAGLIFLHHSCGNDWLLKGLDAKLLAKSYIGTSCGITYGTDVAPNAGRPDSLRADNPPGHYTDMYHWVRWFNDYFEGIQSFGREAGRNNIVMFKSCFPTSNIAPDGDEAGDPFSLMQTLANYKAVFRHPGGTNKTYAREGVPYNSLAQVFAENPGTLFIPVTAPPRHYAPEDASTDAEAARARAFCNWLKGDWLAAYNTANPGMNNVAVFDWFDVLAYPADDPNLPNRLRAEYGGNQGDSHPNRLADNTSAKIFAGDAGSFLDKAWKAYALK